MPASAARPPLRAPLATLALAAALGAQHPPSDAFPAATPESQGLQAAAVAQLDAAVTGYVARGWVVGAELLVVKNRRTVLHEAYGWRDREEKRAMELDTIFNLRSMAKPLVGTAAQLLIDAGRLRPEDPVAKLLPAFDHDAAANITVEHLLTHRSGLPDTQPPKPPEFYGSLRAVADHWCAHGPTEFAPGTEFAYSDPGADVLGAVVAAVAGSSLEAFVTRRVLEPLGMVDTFAMTDDHDPRNARISSDYRLVAAGFERYWKPGDGPLIPFVQGAGTTWYGTPRDYARLLAVWMDGGRLDGAAFLSPAAVERALAPRSSMPYPTRLRGLRVRYGQMWIVYVAARGEPAGRAMPVCFGHSGSDGTYAWAFPEQDLMVLYFTQSRGQTTRLGLEMLISRLVNSR